MAPVTMHLPIDYLEAESTKKGPMAPKYLFAGGHSNFLCTLKYHVVQS
jgi:hypothetical protein